ncbi:MAG: DUF4430 domain-containing protein [Oscillospiraceae bacterium]|nr:DUF4430 domain-containing protein [Oscillospiraceae bacterium]
MLKRKSIKLLSVLVCMLLVAALGACAPVEDFSDDPKTPAIQTPTVLGEGSKAFNLSVTDDKGGELFFEIHTDSETVGEALVALNLLEGEPGPYGLYVKKVAGITADYNTNKKYWAFYIDGEYATSGVDTTAITEGSTYALKVQ